MAHYEELWRELSLYIYLYSARVDIAEIHLIVHVYAALSSIKKADWRF